jgi:putative transposase
LTVAGSPHQAALRRGRRSVASAWYVVTTCTARREPRLIPDATRPEKARVPPLLISCLRWLHEQGRARCRGYVVMPDHVHAVVELGAAQTLAGVMHAFGTFTAREINRIQGRRGPVWQRGFYDHQIRDDTSYERHLRYVAQNPVRKGFVEDWERWPWVAIHPPW